MMLHNREKFRYLFIPPLAVAFIIVIILVLSSGCNTLFNTQGKKDQRTSDSSSVKKGDEAKSSGDSTKVNNEASWSKERWIFQKDTTTNVFNINIPKQTPIIYERESGTTKQQIDMGVFDNWRKRFEDSLSLSERTKTKDVKTEVEGSILNFWQIIGLSIAGIVIFAILFILYKISNKLNQLPKILNSRQ